MPTICGRIALTGRERERGRAIYLKGVMYQKVGPEELRPKQEKRIKINLLTN